MLTYLSEIDINLLRLIHHNRLLELDQFISFISLSTTYISIGFILTILIISLIKRSATLRVVFYKMLAVLIVAATISWTMKAIIQRDRPFKTYPDIEKLAKGGNPSFPSGHTLEAFAIAISFSILIPKRKYFIPLIAWAFLVGYSRMALGVHYPFDVAGGMIIGAMTGLLVPAAMNRIPALKANKGP